MKPNDADQKTDEAAPVSEHGSHPLSRRQMLVNAGAVLGGGAVLAHAGRAAAADVPGAQRPRDRSAAKVRTSFRRVIATPVWYEKPAGTLAELAEARELERDGINPAAPPKAERGGDA
jgi:hypothetical protein